MDREASTEGTRLAHHLLLRAIIERLYDDRERAELAARLCSAVEAAHASGAITADHDTLQIALSGIEDACSTPTIRPRADRPR